MLRPFEIRRLEKELSGHTFLHAFEAGLPVFHLILDIRILADRELSAPEEYVLRCVQRGIGTVDAIDFLLRLGSHATAQALALLLSYDLITVKPDDGTRSTEYVLTDDGAEALGRLSLQVPETCAFHAIYDGLTGKLAPSYRDLFINSREGELKGFYLVPSRVDSPAAGDIDKRVLASTIREYRRKEPHRAPKGDLLDLLGIAKTFVECRPCSVAVFDTPDRRSLVFRILDRGVRLEEHERCLTALATARPEVLPFAIPTSSDASDAPSLITPELSQAVENADRLEEELHQLRSVVEAATATQVLEAPSQAPTEGEAAKGPSTREQLEAALAQINALEEQLHSLRHISTDDHPALLEKALKSARKRIIIISPWLSPAVINDDLLRHLRRALDKGVEIVVGWGIPPENESPKARLKDERSLYVLRRLEELAKEKLKGKLRVVKLGDTHEKILVTDSAWAVVTSFNWLSFRGDKKKGFRRETGVYCEVKEFVAKLAEDAMGRIEHAAHQTGEA